MRFNRRGRASRLKLSIITVHYFTPQILFRCLKSLHLSLAQTRLRYEIIVVDNGSPTNFSSQLKRKFPLVKYIKTKINLGFGAANNLAAQKARGKYLFFLNPDTTIYPRSIERLIFFLSTHPRLGLVAPTLVDQSGQIFTKQGSRKLTPLSAIMAHSVIHKFWPNNPIADLFWLKDKSLTRTRIVDVVPGTAMMIKQTIFQKLGGFDSRFFLYFEESDLCLRAQKINLSCAILATSKIKHLWGESTKNINTQSIYRSSRHHYFAKHYGPFLAKIVALVCDFPGNLYNKPI